MITAEAVEAAVHMRGRMNNPKWFDPISGYATFREDQKEYLRAQARRRLENAERSEAQARRAAFAAHCAALCTLALSINAVLIYLSGQGPLSIFQGIAGAVFGVLAGTCYRSAGRWEALARSERGF